MSTSLYSISRFYGFRRGTADNLLPVGYAARAENVDFSDGALQTVVGTAKYPAALEPHEMHRSLVLWSFDGGKNYFHIGADGVIYLAGDATRSYSAAEKGLLNRVLRGWHNCSVLTDMALMTTSMRSFIVPMSDSMVPKSQRRPVVIQTYPQDLSEGESMVVREFGSGMFMCSDAITQIYTNSSSKQTGVCINRIMTDEELDRCEHVGVYFMENATDELDYAASAVSNVDRVDGVTKIYFETPLAANTVSVGHYVKVRGGLSDAKVSCMAMHYGRLFAGGDPEHPSRLYWSCLPGDGRTIEDWSADDASPDTGGGHMEVGVGSQIRALFSMDSQLLIWTDTDLWRLYGATPSTYSLERVAHGYEVRANMRSIANVMGVPYWANSAGLWCYSGSGITRVDSDRSFAYMYNYGVLEKELQIYDRLTYPEDITGYTPGRVTYYDSKLFVDFDLLGMADPGLIIYDLASDSSVFVKLPTRAVSYGDLFTTERGVMYSLNGGPDATFSDWYLLYYGLNSSDIKQIGDYTPEAYPWKEHVHQFGQPYENTSEYIPARFDIDAVWESADLTFGSTSQLKQLKRVALDVTGPVKISVFSPEGQHFERVLYPETGDRRTEWVVVNMPYQNSFRIRFESVNGEPFRIHNGVDFYIDSNQRN